MDLLKASLLIFIVLIGIVRNDDDLVKDSEKDLEGVPKIKQQPNSFYYVSDKQPYVWISCMAEPVSHASIICGDEKLYAYMEKRVSDSGLIVRKFDPLTNKEVLDSDRWNISVRINKTQVMEWFGSLKCRCEVWNKVLSLNKAKKVYSNYAIITESYFKQKFRQVPQSRIVKLFDRVILKCQPPEAKPRAHIIWLKDGKMLTDRDSSILVMQDESQLIINQFEFIHQGVYCCKARSLDVVRQAPCANISLSSLYQWSAWGPCDARKCVIKRSRHCSSVSSTTRVCKNEDVQMRNCTADQCTAAENKLMEIENMLYIVIFVSVTAVFVILIIVLVCFHKKTRGNSHRNNSKLPHSNIDNNGKKVIPVCTTPHTSMYLAHTSPNSFTNSSLQKPTSSTTSEVLLFDPNSIFKTQLSNHQPHDSSPPLSNRIMRMATVVSSSGEMIQPPHSLNNAAMGYSSPCPSLDDRASDSRSSQGRQSLPTPILLSGLPSHQPHFTYKMPSSTHNATASSQSTSPVVSNGGHQYHFHHSRIASATVSMDEHTTAGESRNCGKEMIVWGNIGADGGRLSLQDSGISLFVPNGALSSGMIQKIFLSVSRGYNQSPPLDEGDAQLSPVVICGPRFIDFTKFIILSIPHNAVSSQKQWRLKLMSCKYENNTDNLSWKTIYMSDMTSPSSSNPLSDPNKTNSLVHLHDQFAFVLLRQMDMFCLVGSTSPLSQTRCSLSIRLALFTGGTNQPGDYVADLYDLKTSINNPSLCLRCFIIPDTQEAFWTVMNWESQNGGRLVKLSHAIWFGDNGENLVVRINDIGPGWTIQHQLSLSQTIEFESIWRSHGTLSSGRGLMRTFLFDSALPDAITSASTPRLSLICNLVAYQNGFYSNRIEQEICISPPHNTTAGVPTIQKGCTNDSTSSLPLLTGDSFPRAATTHSGDGGLPRDTGSHSTVLTTPRSDLNNNAHCNEQSANMIPGPIKFQLAQLLNKYDASSNNDWRILARELHIDNTEFLSRQNPTELLLDLYQAQSSSNTNSSQHSNILSDLRVLFQRHGRPDCVSVIDSVVHKSAFSPTNHTIIDDPVNAVYYKDAYSC